MSRIDLFFMSLKNLWRRKLRTLLTVTGVMIGATSIVLMISFGLGIERKNMAQMSEFGDIRLVNMFSKYSNDGKITKIKDKDIKKIEKMENVEIVIPQVSVDVRMLIGREATYTIINGYTTKAMKALGYTPIKGKMFKDSDKNVLIVGPNLKKNFSRIGGSSGFGYEKMGMVMGDIYGGGFKNTSGPPKEKDLFKSFIKISYEHQYGELTVELPDGVQMPPPINVKVIGEIEGKFYPKSELVAAPVEFVKSIIELKERYEAKKNKQPYTKKKGNEYENVQVMVDNVDNVKKVVEAIKELGFEAYGNGQYIEEEQKRSQTLQIFLGAIGGVSLLIAAIGITNTMIMAVNERRKEIGIMKVLGSEMKDIKKMFLTEAGLIGFIGGLVGIGISYLASFIVNSNSAIINTLLNGGYVPPHDMMTEADKLGISYIPVYLAVVAMVFSVLIGLIAGYLPARRAMKMTVLQAIQDE